MKIIDKEKKEEGIYGYHIVSGWLKNFFLYSSSNTILETFDEEGFESVSIKSLSKSYVKAPVKLNIEDNFGKIE